MDLDNLHDSSITLELSDPEETICELTIKIKRSKPWVFSHIFEFLIFHRKSEVIFDDRVQFSPSRRTDIYPEQQTRANSTIRHSMTMTESSMDGLDTDQNTLETSHNGKFLSTTDHQRKQLRKCVKYTFFRPRLVDRSQPSGWSMPCSQADSRAETSNSQRNFNSYTIATRPRRRAAKYTSSRWKLRERQSATKNVSSRLTKAAEC